MVREFELPDVGEGLTEAEIVSWFVEPGDSVSEGQPVAEVETDKAVVEVPAPVDGTVRERRADPGDVVAVGEVIITFDVGDEPVGETGEAATATTESRTEPEPSENGTGDENERTFAAPSARRRARELGVDIQQVEETGPGGRITEGDVRSHATSGGTESVTRSDVPSETRGVDSIPTGRSGTADRETSLALPTTRRIAREADVDINAVPTDHERNGEAFVTADQVREYADTQRAAQAADAEAARTSDGETVQTADREAVQATEEVRNDIHDESTDRTERRVEYSGIRRTIGESMERSKYTAPHATHHDAVDVTRLVEVRKQLTAETEDGLDLTYMPFVMKAVVSALEEFPMLNSQLDEEKGDIVVKQYYNIGVATATDSGLIVPVVEDVDRKGLRELAEETNDLVGKARDRSIAREELQGSTFTITNFGAIGGEYATPIINYPETAILGLGALEERPVVEGGDVVVRHTLPLSLAIDHRVIDGAEAAQFVNEVQRILANPELLLLE